jgi:DNA-binding transcriptional LysR family regulator
LSFEVRRMDLDLVLVRAFVTVVDEAHFGRAAEILSVSQQAVSKRVARLETQLGARLLTRDASGVTLTAAGRRFLGPARKALAAGDLAAAVARHEERPLRIDVWGHLFAPMRTVQQALEHAPGLDVELGPGRDLPAVISALSRGEIDAGFGRVHPADMPDGDLAHRLVRLEPVDAILSPGHPLAGRDELRPADLRGSTLVFPAAAARLDFLVRFADKFGISDRSEGPNLGFAHFLDRVSAGPRCFSLLPADVPLPVGTALRTVPLADPTPLYAWSLIWRRDDHHPRLPELAEAFAAAGRGSRWLEYRPSADWLPDPDRAQAHSISSERAGFLPPGKHPRSPAQERGR